MKKLNIQSAFTKWQFLTTINCGFVICGDTITLNKVFDGQNKHFLKRLKKYNLQIKSEKTYLIYGLSKFSLNIFLILKICLKTENGNTMLIDCQLCLSAAYPSFLGLDRSHIQMVRLLNPWVVLMI